MSQHGLQGNKLYCIYLILYLFNSTNFQVYHFHIAHNTPYIPPPPLKNLDNTCNSTSIVLPFIFAPGAKLLRVYQRFHGYTSSSGAEFPPRKMLHDI